MKIQGELMMKTNGLAKMRTPERDLCKLEAMISVYGMGVRNNCDFLFFCQLPCELDFLFIHGMFAFLNFKLRVKLEMRREDSSTK